MCSFVDDDEDINEEDYEKYYIPIERNFNKFMNKYIIPEIISYQIVSYYYDKCLVKTSLLQHYRGMTKVFSSYPNLEVKE